MLLIVLGDHQLGAVTSWNLHWLPGNRMVTTKLHEVTAPGQEIVRHMTLRKTTACCFYTLAFVRIKQTGYNVLICVH